MSQISKSGSGGGGGFGSPTYFAANLSAPVSFPSNTTTNTIVFDTTTANVGSAYNTATGVFTAPATGFYAFSANIFYQPATGTTTYNSAYTGNVLSVRSGQTAVTTPLHNFSWEMPMTVGDTIHISPFADGTGNFQIFGAALSTSPFSVNSTFSGYRVA